MKKVIERFVDIKIGDRAICVRANVINGKVVFEYFTDNLDITVREMRTDIAELVAVLDQQEALVEYVKEHGGVGQPTFYFDPKQAVNLFPFAEWAIEEVPQPAQDQEAATAEGPDGPDETPEATEADSDGLVIEPQQTEEEKKMEYSHGNGKFKLTLRGWAAWGAAAALIAVAAATVAVLSDKR